MIYIKDFVNRYYFENSKISFSVIRHSNMIDKVDVPFNTVRLMPTN